MAAVVAAKTAAATCRRSGSWTATSAVPTPSETKKAYWCKTPRRRGRAPAPGAGVDKGDDISGEATEGASRACQVREGSGEPSSHQATCHRVGRLHVRVDQGDIPLSQAESMCSSVSGMSVRDSTDTKSRRRPKERANPPASRFDERRSVQDLGRRNNDGQRLATVCGLGRFCAGKATA